MGFVLITNAQQQSFRYDIVKVIDRTMTLDSSDAGIADMDTIIWVSDIYPTEVPDSLLFAVEILADSTLEGTARDSIHAYLRVQWVSPANLTNTTNTISAAGFAAQDSVMQKLHTTAGTYFVTPQPANFMSARTKIKVWLWLRNMQPSVRQTVYAKVYMIRKWID